MNYTLRDDEGNVLDASEGEPLEFLHGHSNIIPGLERELTGLKVGDKKKVSVTASDAYGEYDPELELTLEREQFKGEVPPEGAMVELQSEDGDVIFGRVARVTDKEVVLDANHPLAGKRLHFDVEITSVRDASEDELSHGHPHGPDGHHHHHD
jgi:FKBP-type peptidyl-prolyl cis-trans isomerase SlyD